MIIDKTSYYMEGVNTEVFIFKNEHLKWNYKETINCIHQSGCVKAYFRVNSKGEFYSLENQ
jgi:hypothetical protein